MANAAEIEQAYRWILGREADPAGLETYRPDYESGRLSWQVLRRIMLDSQEFAAGTEDYRAVRMQGGSTVIVDANEPDFGRAIVDSGAWEPHVISAIVSSLRPGDVYVDIGGNVGVMAFNAAKAVGPTGKVIAFEPNPRNTMAFQRGMLANGTENVRLFAMAVSDVPRMVSITRMSNAKTSTTIDPLQTNYVVQALPADELLAGEPRIDFIKIDIEGFELPALQGLSQTLARHKPLVLCEFNPLCLGEAGFTPSILADRIFDLTDEVQVIDHSDERFPVRSTSELIAFWEKRDREVVEAGHLAPGCVHFDLLFRADRSSPKA